LDPVPSITASVRLRGFASSKTYYASFTLEGSANSTVELDNNVRISENGRLAYRIPAAKLRLHLQKLQPESSPPFIKLLVGIMTSGRQVACSRTRIALREPPVARLNIRLNSNLGVRADSDGSAGSAGKEIRERVWGWITYDQTGRYINHETSKDEEYAKRGFAWHQRATQAQIWVKVVDEEGCFDTEFKVLARPTE